MRRQQWLQRNQAVQVINAYAEAMSMAKGNSEPAHRGNGRSTPAGKKVGGGALLGMMRNRVM